MSNTGKTSVDHEKAGAKLYVVPTPIGNLEDMTFRAIRILKIADLILAEDTRTSGFLLKHFEIKTPMQSHHKFNEHKTVETIVQRIKSGQTIALISDAGTPAISDPGFLVVRQCVENGIEVECLPGATAFVPALVASGLPNDRFCFEGFLPQKKGRQTKINDLSTEKRKLRRVCSIVKNPGVIKNSDKYTSKEREVSEHVRKLPNGKEIIIKKHKRHYYINKYGQIIILSE